MTASDYASIQELQDAKTDINNLETFTNSAGTWTPRLGGGPFKTLRQYTIDFDGEISVAQAWASETDEAVVTSPEDLFSAKEYAQGSQSGTGGSALNWAQEAGGVTGAGANDRSAKSWAQEVLTGVTLGGSAKDWAQTAEDTLVDGSEYSAKHYAAKAQAALDLINAQYLGAQASDPTEDLNGDPLTAGDWYFNTSSQKTRIYDGSIWGDAIEGATLAANNIWTGDNTFEGDLDLSGVGNVTEIRAALNVDGITATALKALDVTDVSAGDTRLISDGGRSGVFEWVSGDQSANVTADPQEGIYVPPDSDDTGASGAWKRTFDGSLNVKWFGAVADYDIDTDTYTTNNSVPIQAAIDWLEDGRTINPSTSDAGQGKVFIPAGYYGCDSTVTISEAGITLIGEGGRGASNKVVGYYESPGVGYVQGRCEDQGATSLYFNNASGDGIRFKNDFCGIRSMSVNATPTRAAGTQSETTAGVRVEGNDVAPSPTAGTTRGFNAYDLGVFNHPGNGIMLVNEVVSSLLDNVHSYNNKAHGIVVCGGVWTSRTNKVQPGIVDIERCTGGRNGGHGLCIGGKQGVSFTDLVYRVSVKQFDTFSNGLDPTILLDQTNKAGCYISGENIRVVQSAFDGRRANDSSSNFDDVYYTIAAYGRNIEFDNCRFIDGNPGAAYFGLVANISMEETDIKVLNPYVVNTQQSADFYDPAFVFASGIKRPRVEMSETGETVASVMTKTVADDYFERDNSAIETTLDYTFLGALEDGSGPLSHRFMETRDTDYTFDILDNRRIIRYNGGGSHTYTIPTNSAVALGIGSELRIENISSADLTLSRSTGVTLVNVADGATTTSFTIPAKSHAKAIKLSTDIWYVWQSAPTQIKLASGDVPIPSSGIVPLLFGGTGGTTHATALDGLGVRYQNVSISDDAVWSIQPDGGSFTSAVAAFISNSITAGPAVLAYLRGTSSPSFNVIASADPSTAIGTTGTTALAGTTGTDTKVNFAVDTSGNIYVENRRGSTIGYTIFWFLGQA
jgi:hypothetical protein